MFSGFNVLRSNFAVNDKQGRVVEYSQDYLFFYDQLEKANLMLQGVIDLGKKSIEDPQVRSSSRTLSTTVVLSVALPTWLANMVLCL